MPELLNSELQLFRFEHSFLDNYKPIIRAYDQLSHHYTTSIMYLPLSPPPPPLSLTLVHNGTFLFSPFRILVHPVITHQVLAPFPFPPATHNPPPLLYSVCWCSVHGDHDFLLPPVHHLPPPPPPSLPFPPPPPIPSV